MPCIIPQSARAPKIKIMFFSSFRRRRRCRRRRRHHHSAECGKIRMAEDAVVSPPTSFVHVRRVARKNHRKCLENSKEELAEIDNAVRQPRTTVNCAATIFLLFFSASVNCARENVESRFNCIFSTILTNVRLNYGA